MPQAGACGAANFATLGLVGRQCGTETRRGGEGSDSLTPVGTDQQLEGLVREYGPVLYKVAFAVTRDHALAEEVVQDALFRAWSSMPSWEGDVPIRWMRRVVRNRAVSVMRKESRSSADEHWERYSSSDPDVERVVEGRQVADAVLDALEDLDEESRTMLVLRETEDMSYAELGAMLDLTSAAVKAKLFRARHTLKSRLREWEL